jgi:lipoyl-dependent peroxiredoxin
VDRKASVIWEGGLKGGNGKITTGSGALSNLPYSFGTRFEGTPGTNPEELIAAAHAGCFSMALAMQLETAGIKPEVIQTRATVTLDNSGGGFAVTRSHLEVTARAPGVDEQAFLKAAETAKANCPISKLLNTKITLSAALSQR